MNDTNGKIKWDASNKDQRDAERIARDNANNLVRAMETCTEAYTYTKNTLERHARHERLKPQTIYDLYRALLGDVDKATKQPGCEEYRRITMTMVEDAMNRALAANLAANLGAGNWILEAPSPDSGVTPEGDIPLKVAPFTSEEELNAIPWVSEWTQQAGYIGLVRQGRKLMALFPPGPLAIGTLGNNVGCEKIPTIEAFSAAMKEKP